MSYLSDQEELKRKQKEYIDGLEEKLEASDEELLNFINGQIMNMSKRIIKWEYGSPPLSVLSEALATHSQTMLALQSLYEAARLELSRAKKIYEVWHAEKYMEIREKYATIEKTSRTERLKFLSKDEIEMQIIADYKDEYLLFKGKIDAADEKRSTADRLISTWSSYQFELTQISKNALAEYSSEMTSYRAENRDMASEVIRTR